MNDIHVGQKIQEYRKKKALNIRQLADLVVVTPSLLSQIERGLANPSIHTLKLIAKVLEVPVFNFFLEQENTNNLIVRSNHRKKMILPECEHISYELLSPDLNGAIEYALMKLTPGTQSSEALMEHVGEEAAFVLEGEVKLYLNDEVHILSKGDSVRIPPHMKHKWENAFDQNVVVIFAVTPPSF
ncbi:cupin domain-containing protein [Brevibacillus reuszeri]|uniref:cupin domain-containing protein n=1 Tax=Brevibacillus reuszeri TaxID=54915 RepID=UPI00289D595E|nr:cupin domain-containing protein [Brevibacillus reuszeri]